MTAQASPLGRNSGPATPVVASDTRSICGPVIVFSEAGRLAGCLAAGMESRDGGSAGEPQAARSDGRARVSETVPLRPAITRARRNSAARRVFVPDGTTAL